MENTRPLDALMMEEQVKVSIPVDEGVLGEEGQRVVQIGKCKARENGYSGLHKVLG